MTENPTKFTVFHKKPTNHNILHAVKYFDKCFSSLQMSFMQYDYEPRLFKQMFKMSPFGFHTSKKTLSPLAYGCVDDAHGRQLPRLQVYQQPISNIDELRERIVADFCSLPDLNPGCLAATETEK